MLNNNLRNLLNPWISKKIPELYVNNIKLDSREIKKNDLFVGLNGTTYDGKSFIHAAINQGAVAILIDSEKKQAYYNKINNIPAIFLPSLKKNISNIAGRFYNYPDQNLSLIAITGTNGKTSITQLIAQWVHLLGIKSATMGTIGNGLYNQTTETRNTTDSPIEIQNTLYSFVQNKVKLAAIEVSSHALIQHRVKALHFAAAVFTNLSHEHLDYHKDMTCYEQAKWRLFSEHQVGYSIINLDDAIGKKWLRKLSKKTVAVSMQNHFISDYANQWIKVKNITYKDHYILISIHSTWGQGTIKSFLIGNFNIMNLLLSLATLLVLNYSFDDLIKISEQLKPISGRMEMFTIKKNKKIIVDYAHTPDGLKQALKAIKLHFKGKIWCVFGCGGDRDQKKRSLMGHIAEKYADMLVITHDNPRNENPKKIIQDIISGIQFTKKITIIEERKEAIFYSVNQACANDIIYIAGKGHEQYQIINNIKIRYSDQNTIKSLFRVEK